MKIPIMDSEYKQQFMTDHNTHRFHNLVRQNEMVNNRAAGFQTPVKKSKGLRAPQIKDRVEKDHLVDVRDAPTGITTNQASFTKITPQRPAR